MAADVKNDPRLKLATPEEQERLLKIQNPMIVESSLNVIEAMHEIKNKKQYMTMSEFKKYIPLYNERIMDDLLLKKGVDHVQDLISGYYSKINIYKPVHLVNNMRDKTVVAVLPAVGNEVPAISFSDNSKLDTANSKINSTHRPDKVEEGQMELMQLLRKAAKEDTSIKLFAEARLDTEELTRKLDEQRDAYYKQKFGTTKGVTSAAPAGSTPSNITISFDDDDEIFD